MCVLVVITKGYEASCTDIVQASAELTRVFSMTKRLRHQETVDRREDKKGILYMLDMNMDNYEFWAHRACDSLINRFHEVIVCEHPFSNSYRQL